jgi:hypothetical protein
MRPRGLKHETANFMGSSAQVQILLLSINFRPLLECLEGLLAISNIARCSDSDTQRRCESEVHRLPSSPASSPKIFQAFCGLWMKPLSFFNLANVSSLFVQTTCSLVNQAQVQSQDPHPKSCHSRCLLPGRSFITISVRASSLRVVGHNRIASHLQIIAANSLHSAVESIFGISFQV